MSFWPGGATEIKFHPRSPSCTEKIIPWHINFTRFFTDFIQSKPHRDTLVQCSLVTQLSVFGFLFFYRFLGLRCYLGPHFICLLFIFSQIRCLWPCQGWHLELMVVNGHWWLSCFVYFSVLPSACWDVKLIRPGVVKQSLEKKLYHSFPFGQRQTKPPTKVTQNISNLVSFPTRGPR